MSPRGCVAVLAALCLAGCGSVVRVGSQDASTDDVVAVDTPSPLDVVTPRADVVVPAVDVVVPAVDVVVPTVDVVTPPDDAVTPVPDVALPDVARVDVDPACLVDPAGETCNGRDDNCNGLVDEMLLQGCYTGASSTAGVGTCRSGVQLCATGAWGSCMGQVLPATERCDGQDNDCNGTVDDPFAAQLGRPCMGATGACARMGVTICNADGSGTRCSLPSSPTAETCNGIDDDCNGLVDDGVTRGCYDGPAGTSGVGQCRPGTQACAAGAWGACTGEIVPQPELCDNADNNCNGAVDESLVQRCASGAWAGTAHYTRSEGPRRYYDACGATGHRTYFAGLDDGITTEALPFPFTAYGRPLTTVWVSPNGTLGFAMIPTIIMNTALPSATVTAAVFPWWDDLIMRDGVCTATFGAAPTRVWVAEWRDALVFPRNDAVHLTFEVVLAETSNTIDVFYQRLEGPNADGSAATIGIQGSTMMGQYDQVSFNAPVTPTLVGRGFRWTPEPIDSRGICRAGAQSCARGTWGTCVGEVGPMAREVCGNGADDDCNGSVDDGCP